MVNSQGIQHIFFDLDRTLWDYDRNVKEALFELHAEHLSQRVPSDAETFHRVFLFENGKLWEDFTANKINKDYLRAHRFLYTLRRLGLPDPKLALHLEDRYMETTPAKTHLLPGVHEVLTELSTRYALHILTNGFEDAQRFKLQNSGIDGYFDQIITSDAARSTKPNKAIFVYSEKKAATLPKHCLMIGDDWNVDVLGARKAGWQAIHVHPDAEAGVRDLRELTDMLQ